MRGKGGAVSEKRKRRLEEGAPRPEGAAAAEPRPETEEIIRKIDALLHRLVQASPAGDDAADADSVQAAARRACRARRKRERIFGSRLFADLSWDILVDLFVAKHEGREISLSRACIAASAPGTTALRHIAHLAQAGLIVRRPHPSGARGTYLEITDIGTAKLTRYFSAWPAPERPAA
jgi:hypothetical protein